MARTMRKKTWTVIAVANDTRHLWSCLQKATDAHDAMRQCVAEMGTVDPSNFQIIGDRKSTRLNSSHLGISYAVFCLKKKKNKTNSQPATQHDDTNRTATQTRCTA